MFMLPVPTLPCVHSRYTSGDVSIPAEAFSQLMIGAPALKAGARRARFGVVATSSPIAKNILVPHRRKSPPNRRRLVLLKGRIAIVTDAGRDAVDAGGALTKARIADGEVVWA